MEMNCNEIKTHADFEQLFEINKELLDKIKTDIEENHYDPSQPIILATWNGQTEPVCIDGHTRLKAAIDAGLEEVPVFIHEFDTEQEALEKAIKLQVHRRNISDSELFHFWSRLDGRSAVQRNENGKFAGAPNGATGRSSAATAELLGTSPRKVERMRTIADHADQETLEAVDKGEITINKGYEQTQERRREAQRSNPGTEESQMQTNVADEKLEPGEKADLHQQDGSDTDTDDDEDDEIDPDDAEAVTYEEPGNSEASRSYGDPAEEDGFMMVRISLAQYEALSQYRRTIEEMLEEAIDNYLKHLELLEGLERADYEAMWENGDKDEDEEYDLEAVC